MISSFQIAVKRAPLPGDEPEEDPARVALEWELSVVRDEIAVHRAASSDIYATFDARQSEAERRLFGAADDGQDWQAVVSAMRAERVGVANERSNRLRELRRRERELEAQLGEGW